MARKKTNKKVEPDEVYTYKNGKIEVALYERDGEKISAKITLLDCFVIYARVVMLDHEAFIAFPSFKNKDGDYVKQAFCYDKELMQKINGDVSEHCFG